MRRRSPWLLGLILMSLAVGTAVRPTSGRACSRLPEYLLAGDDSYAWRVERTIDMAAGKVTHIHLTSQTWRGIPWTHWLTIIQPAEIRHPEHALLVISGGSNRANPPVQLSAEAVLLAQVAQQTGTLVAVLAQVPNQPLLDGRHEDALIAHTFERYISTGDPTWPALLPMTKSALRAMDAVQEFAAKDLGQRVEKFFVTGASKRGWTTWLTGAADGRVSGIAPMVIDALNMPAQMKHQVACFGAYSERIDDYTRLDLPNRLQEPEAQKLLDMVDPYSYRDRLVMPKLVVLGTNDPYWPVDAARFYFHDLVGESYMFQLPNAGHGLGPGALPPVVAFYQTILEGSRRPRFSWDVRTGEGHVALVVEAEDPPKGVRLWTASSEDRDFRKDRWHAKAVEGEAGKWVARIDVPEEGYVAFFAALTYESSLGYDFELTTTVEVVGGKD